MERDHSIFLVKDPVKTIEYDILINYPKGFNRSVLKPLEKNCLVKRVIFNKTS